MIIQIQEAFHYDPVSGEICWRADRPKEHFARQNEYQAFLNHRAGKLVKTSVNAYGYLVVGLGQKIIPVHKIAVILMTGRVPVATIDHIDGNPRNNQWENLREVSQKINTRNQKKNARNSSGFAGVSWSKRRNKWVSQVYIDSKHKFLGHFDNAEDAYQARMEFLNANKDLGYTEDHGHRIT